MNNIKLIEVKTSKYEFNDPFEKDYWKSLIESLDKKAFVKNKKSKVKKIDLSQTVNNKLYNRISKIIKLTPEDKFQNDTNNLDSSLPNQKNSILQPQVLTTREANFNESTVEKILDQEKEFLKIDLKIDFKPEPRKITIEYDNWLSNYTQKNQKDRIIWHSKLYKFEKRLLDKSLYEQANELIDLTATDFTKWINELSTDSRTEISKDLIKDLFPIGLEGDASKALYVEPIQIKAIPNEVAQLWNLPDLALESNVTRMMKQDNIEDKKPIKYVAFGKTLPMELRHMKSIQTTPLKTAFPNDLKTKEALFRGINHLRSTKALVQHFLDNPHLKRPNYLKEKGLFLPVISIEESKHHIPLYQHYTSNH